jgi:N-glycosylase/DNA lyase
MSTTHESLSIKVWWICYHILQTARAPLSFKNPVPEQYKVEKCTLIKHNDGVDDEN